MRVGFFPGHPGVLVPGRDMRVAAAGDIRGQFGASVLNRAAADLGTDQRLDHVELMVVDEEFERGPAAEVDNVELFVNLVVIAADRAQAAIEGLVGVELGNLARGQQVFGAMGDVFLVFGDDRVEIRVGQRAAQQQIALFFELCNLVGTEFHKPYSRQVSTAKIRTIPGLSPPACATGAAAVPCAPL